MHEIVKFPLIGVSSLFIVLPLYLSSEFICDKRARGIVQNSLALALFLSAIYWVIVGAMSYEI